MQNNINFYDTTTVLNEVEPTISSIPATKIIVDSEAHPHPHVDNPNIMVDQTKQPYNYENFHLDPQDFQNFLLINPPLTEYSNYYYMNAYNNNNNNNNNSNSHSNSHNNHSFHNTNETQANPASITDSSLPTEFNENLLDNLDPNSAASTFEPQSSSTQFPQQSQLQRGQPNSFTSLQAAAIPTPQLTHNNSNNNAINHHNHTHNQQHHSLNANSLSSSFQPFPKRRLSISNGQIGQISMMVHQKDLENLENNNLNSNSQIRNINNNFDDDIDNENEIEVDDDDDEGNAPIEVDKNGVPCRQLIYNNQVIFNPDGPIPGTASWKRQKILERNRIAASKCRQKKKNLQKKLQQDVEELNKKNSKLESMLNNIKARLTIYSEKTGISVDDILGINNSSANNNLDKSINGASNPIKSEIDDHIPIDMKVSKRNSKTINGNVQFDDDVELERKLCEWMRGAEM